VPTGARINVKGLAETYRAFGNISEDVQDELRDGLEEVGKPVQALGERYALERIRNMPRSPAWAEMRIGVSKREALVYMVPDNTGRAGRGRGKRKRKNLASLLMNRAMDTAGEDNVDTTARELEKVIDKLSRREGF